MTSFLGATRIGGQLTVTRLPYEACEQEKQNKLQMLPLKARLYF